jgi:hypothetical protein
MIFMSQSGLADPARDADWDTWYIEHLRIMASVCGVDSAQRFKTRSALQSPSLALYTLRSAAVFRDPHYLSIRGLGAFADLIDRRWYRRNLFEGLARAPAVQADERLLVHDSAGPVHGRAGVAMTPLEAVDLDRSTPWRCIAVAPAAGLDAAALEAAGVAVYVPATDVFPGTASG